MDQRVFLGRYQAVRLLGEGGTSRVYLARANDTGRQVVVKVLHEHLAADPRFRDCFQRELMLLQRFRHPDAVALLDASVIDPGSPCIVMEYISGVDLETLWRRQRIFSPLRVGRMLAQICQVLEAAHAQGIIHRDLKPANLMVVHPDTPQEQLRVMDFGLGQLATTLYIPLEQLSSQGEEFAAGTPEYMPPEEVRRDMVDYRCDLYSLGVILYQLLTGRLPFTGTPRQLLQAHMDKAPPPFSQTGTRMPAGIEAVVMSCLSKFPTERPQSASEVAERYEEALGTKCQHGRRRKIVAQLATSAPKAEPAIEKVIDAQTVVRQMEAFMPEKIAVVKLRGFVEDIGGEAIESIPGKIRVRLGERRELVGAGGPTFLSWLGVGKKSNTISVVHPTEMELYMEKKESHTQNYLQLTILLRPEHGRAQFNDPEWHAYCDKIYRELRAYLMGRG